MPSEPARLTRIGVFFDGSYFAKVSEHYRYVHPRRSWLSITGLLDFVCRQVAQEEQADPRRCTVVDSHYFRGRFPAKEAEAAGRLSAERVFDDILMFGGVITHYLPVYRNPHTGRAGEKGIDVWLALEAYELTRSKGYDVLALVSGDADYVPLIRKVHTLGTRTLLLAWEFDTPDETGWRQTRVAQRLRDEVTYPVLVHQLIESPEAADGDRISGLFQRTGDEEPAADGVGAAPSRAAVTVPEPARPHAGVVGKIFPDKGFGFILCPDFPKELFFGFHSVSVARLLVLGEAVTFAFGQNDKGPCAVAVRPQNS
ncbi:MAG: NYN domain-containing protein [Limisphaerales bacterium]